MENEGASMDLTFFASEWCPAPTPAPDDAVIFAIGDMHGCLAHVDAMLALAKELGTTSAHRDVHLVTIGDYVDRGVDSLGVLERVRELTAETWATVHTLRGNHDQFLIDFLEHPETDPAFMDLWRANGGDRTLAEMGISHVDLYRQPLADLRRRGREALPPGIHALLDGLQSTVRLGDWLFVHAGVHPTRPLAEQTPAELLWIRAPFLQGAGWRHDFCVVHGHTIRGHEILPHRVAIDSGAYHTGILSGVEIERDRLRFLAVGIDPDLRWLESLPGHPPDRRYTALTTIRVTAD